MKFQIGKNEYQIKWEHHRAKEVGQRSFTRCKIESNSGIQQEACSLVSLKDNYCKETGRKLTLSRVLRSVGFTKETKTMIWNEYFKMTNQKQYVKEAESMQGV